MTEFWKFAGQHWFVFFITVCLALFVLESIVANICRIFYKNHYADDVDDDNNDTEITNVGKTTK